MRCRISEDDEPGRALAKSVPRSKRLILDAEERAFVEPRLAHLLGLGEHQARDKQDLLPRGASSSSVCPRAIRPSSPSRTCNGPTRACSIFVELPARLVAKPFPLYVITLARRSCTSAGPTWGPGATSRRCTSSRFRGGDGRAPDRARPRPAERSCATGFARAEGVPLYAVETGPNVCSTWIARPGGIGLTADSARSTRSRCRDASTRWIAARLDGLSARSAGCFRTQPFWARPSRREGLARLPARRDAAGRCSTSSRAGGPRVQADPRSPEHGHTDSYRISSARRLRDACRGAIRRSRHLAAADYLATTFAADVDEWSR